MEIDWKDIPLFCPNDYVLPKELDKETENTSLGALINLAYGEPSREEKIENWKEKGKQYFQNKKYKQAVECYTEALNEWQKESTDKWTGCVLYSNRAAAQLGLQNYGKALQDCQQSLALGNFEKSYYRGCIAALAIQKWQEAQVLLQRAKENHAMKEQRVVELEDKIRACREQPKRQEKQPLKKDLQNLIHALQQRNIRLGLPIFISQKWSSKTKPELESCVALCWPVLFVYPIYEYQSDFVESCEENTKLGELLNLLFHERPPWDYRGLYQNRQSLQVFYYSNWTRCLEATHSAVEYLYGNGKDTIETCSKREYEMGNKVVVSQQLCLSQVITRKDYIVPLYPVFFVMPS